MIFSELTPQNWAILIIVIVIVSWILFKVLGCKHCAKHHIPHKGNEHVDHFADGEEEHYESL